MAEEARMEVPVEAVGPDLMELVRRAEAGEEIVLTRDGRSVARLGPVQARPLTPEQRGRIIDEIVQEARGRALPGPDAAHAADYLYNEFGLPG
jgi:antitoxin (DNA-binding transcriptional repressor) of toxin-antitoxin stability system